MNKRFLGILILSLIVPALSQAALPLQTGTPDEIVASIDEVATKNIRDKATVSSLVQALESPETDVRVKERAAWALGQIKASSAVKPLLAAADNKGLLVRSAALNSLVKIRATAALPRFIEIAFNDPVLTLRQRATLALGILKSEKAIDSLVKLSSDVREEIQGAAVLAMSNLHSKKNDFTEILGQFSNDANPYVQERAKKALIMIHGKPEQLKTLLADPDQDVRLFTALTYTSKGKSSDLKSLQAAENGEAVEDVRDELQTAIRAIKKRAAAAAAAKKRKKKPSAK